MVCLRHTRIRTKRQRNKKHITLEEIMDLADWDFVDAIGDYIVQETGFVNPTMRLAGIAQRLKEIDK